MSRRHPARAVAVVLGLGLMWLPMLAVAVMSVNRARSGLAWRGFTVDWYLRLMDDEAIRDAAVTSLALATASTAVATVLGTALAFGLRDLSGRRSGGWLALVVDLPIVTPDIIFAAALVVAFAVMRHVLPALEPGFGAMVIGHVTFQIAFVALVVSSRLATLGATLAEAAADLGAPRGYALRRVTGPLVAPAVAAGAVLAFTLSLDDFVISFFTAGPRSDTIPILVYSSMRRGLSPELNALSTLVVAITVALVLVLERLTRVGRPA